MVGRAFDLLTQRPDLLVDHASAYVTLAKDEVASAKANFMVRIASGLIASIFGTAALIVIALAVMMQLSGQAVFAPQAWTVPAVIAAIALIAVLRFRRKASTNIGESLATQLQADASLLREFMGTR